jgi:hypothetical protein
MQTCLKTLYLHLECRDSEMKNKTVTYNITKFTENKRPMQVSRTSLSWKSNLRSVGYEQKMILVSIIVHVWIIPEILHGHVHICFHVFSSTIKFNTNTNNLYFKYNL